MHSVFYFSIHYFYFIFVKNYRPPRISCIPKKHGLQSSVRISHASVQSIYFCVTICPLNSIIVTSLFFNLLCFSQLKSIAIYVTNVMPVSRLTHTRCTHTLVHIRMNLSDCIKLNFRVKNVSNNFEVIKCFGRAVQFLLMEWHIFFI